MSNEYDIGDEIVLQGVFTDREAVPTDPTDVVCRVLDPEGTVTVCTAASTGDDGTWEATFAPTVNGTHWYRFEGTGDLVAAGENSFVVRKQRVPAAAAP